MNKKADNPILAEITNLDKLIHEPARLAIVSLLYVVNSAAFTFVLNQTGLTFGNLSAHISKLEDAGYVELQKGYKGKRPNTSLKLTEQGKQAFQNYARKINGIFEDFDI